MPAIFFWPGSSGAAGGELVNQKFAAWHVIKTPPPAPDDTKMLD